MATVIKKGKIGVNDITFYSSASPTFYRTTSSGGATNVTAVGATHLPITTAAASFQFSVNNVNRAVNELGARARTASARFITMGASLVSNAASHKSVSASLKSSAATLAVTVPFFYRNNKPQLSYALYGATWVVSCPASTDAPSVVYINNTIYKNTGTILCDISRTKTPATATVGGMDRGPATTARAIYFYAVPKSSPTATRQWDLFASSTFNAMTAAATFPQWSFLGAGNVGVPSSVCKFSQSGDKFELFAPQIAFIRGASNIIYNATFLSTYSALYPTGISDAKYGLKIVRTGAPSNIGYYYILQGGDLTTSATFNGTMFVQVPGWALSGGLSNGYTTKSIGYSKPSVAKYVRHRIGGSSFSAATSTTITGTLEGFTIPRGNYK